MTAAACPIITTPLILKRLLQGAQVKIRSRPRKTQSRPTAATPAGYEQQSPVPGAAKWSRPKVGDATSGLSSGLYCISYYLYVIFILYCLKNTTISGTSLALGFRVPKSGCLRFRVYRMLEVLQKDVRGPSPAESPGDVNGRHDLENPPVASQGTRPLVIRCASQDCQCEIRHRSG